MIIENSYGKFKYLLYEPSHLNNLENLPLIVVMHGSGEIGSSLSKLKKREPYISLNNGKFKTDAYILMPQLPKNTWGKMADDLMKLINKIVIDYKCDKTRISLTGHSLGAMGVIEIMYKYPNAFAAGASLSCAHNYTSYIPKLANIPIWFLHGAKESNYGKYAREMFGVLDKLNEESKLTSIPGYGHPIQPFWCNSKYGIFDWLKQYQIGELKMPTWGDWLVKQKLIDGKGNLTIKVDETITTEDGEKFNIRRGRY